MVDVTRPSRTIEFFELPQARGEVVVAENVFDPARKVPAAQVSVEFGSGCCSNDIDKFPQAAGLLAREPVSVAGLGV